MFSLLLRRETAEETAYEQRHGRRGLADRRRNDLVVHVQSAAPATVGRRGHGRCRAGPGAGGAVQLRRAAARQLPSGDQRPVGQVQRSGHGNDHHENGQVGRPII